MLKAIAPLTTREESGGAQCPEPYTLLPKEYQSEEWQASRVNHMADRRAIHRVIDRVIHRRCQNDEG